jgi:hypothetical protein
VGGRPLRASGRPTSAPTWRTLTTPRDRCAHSGRYSVVSQPPARQAWGMGEDADHLPGSISTDRLLLRRHEVADAEAIAQAIAVSDAELRPWMPWVSEEAKDPAFQRQRLLVAAGVGKARRRSYLHDQATAHECGRWDLRHTESTRPSDPGARVLDSFGSHRQRLRHGCGDGSHGGGATSTWGRARGDSLRSSQYP